MSAKPSRRIAVNLLAFFLVSVVLIAYGVVDLLGNPLRSPTAVSAVFPDASGIYPHFNVTYDGVDVGSVTGVKLVHNGAKVSMAIDPGKTVPDNVQARIGIANDLGQQEVDLDPTRPGKFPPLKSGAVIPVAPNSIPARVGKVVDLATKLLQAIPPGDLNTVLSQLAIGLKGRAADMREIIQAGNTFNQEFLAYQAQFKALLTNAPPVLNAVASVGPQLRQALANTYILTQMLAQRRNELTALLSNGAQATSLAGKLLASQGPDLACIIHDFSQVTADVAQPKHLVELGEGLALDKDFFGPVDAIAPTGPSIALGSQQPASSDQEWLRTRMYIPPKQPSGSAYTQPVQLPPTLPGAGCVTALGNGVGPATQPGFKPYGPHARVVAATTSQSYVPKESSSSPSAQDTSYQSAQAAELAAASHPLPSPLTSTLPAAVILAILLLAGWSAKPRRSAGATMPSSTPRRGRSGSMMPAKRTVEGDVFSQGGDGWRSGSRSSRKGGGDGGAHG